MFLGCFLPPYIEIYCPGLGSIDPLSVNSSRLIGCHLPHKTELMMVYDGYDGQQSGGGGGGGGGGCGGGDDDDV